MVQGGSMVQVGTKRKRDWESKHANDIIGVVGLERMRMICLNGLIVCCFVVLG